MKQYLITPAKLRRIAEKHEITRVFALARKNQDQMHKVKQPSEYTLGTGHVLFFYDKLKFISDRYDSLCNEMVNRGYTCNRVPKEQLHEGINKNMFWDYKPTEKAVRISTERINLRLPK